MENAVASSQNSVSSPSGRQPEPWTIESQEQLINVPKYNLHPKDPRKWKDYLLLALGIMVTILILALIITIVLGKFDSRSTCTSPECIRSANNLLQSMNPDVEPCDNFYKFACDNWRLENIMEEPRFINTWFQDRDRFIKRDILEFLEQEDSDDEPFPVIQTRIVYDACLDFENINDRGLETLWPLLSQLGLPRFPLTKATAPGEAARRRPEVSRIIAKVRRFLGKELLIGFNVLSSLANSSLNQLAIATPDSTDRFLRRKWADPHLEQMLKRSLHQATTDKIRHFRDYSMSVLKFFARQTNVSLDSNLQSKIVLASFQLLQMKQNFSEIETSEDVVGPYINDFPDEMTISELQEFVDNSTSSREGSKIQWETYLLSIFEDIDNVTLDFANDKILVYKRAYYPLISEFLEGLTDENLELFLWWEVMHMLGPHIHEELKTLKDLYTSKVLPTVPLESRPTECAGYVSSFMESAVAYLAVTTFNYTLVDSVSDMLYKIQEAYVESISEMSWMDSATKEATILKIRSMKEFIGIPQWIQDKEALESSYNVTVNSTTHLANLLALIDEEVSDTMKTLREENNASVEHFNPLDINAYYDPSGNSISVPAAIMQFPFYNLGLESLNYGALGSILGHEMTHGLDSYGRKFDLHGNLNKGWWSNESSVEYEKRTDCYVKAYSDYYIDSVNETVNGEVTLAENLADNGGLKSAFLGFRSHTAGFDHSEPKLPGLERFSQKHLFFLGYANIWCAEYTEESLSDTLTYDEHSPQFVRVNEVLQNLAEFSQVWACPLGSKMNPEKKCKLWAD